MRTVSVALSLAFLGVAGCARVMPPENPDSAATEGSHQDGVEPGIQQGHASYYADRFKGRRTSSGEPYDPTALTAAHRTLPFGTVVIVARPDGRSVQVRINDRGPYGPKGRIIDLSRRAAEAIGMIRDGVVEVTVRIVEEGRADVARR